LRRFLNWLMCAEDLIAAVKLFQMTGPATVKTWSTNLVLVIGTGQSKLSAEWSRLRKRPLFTGMTMSITWLGHCWLWTWCIISSISHLILEMMGSQFRSLMADVTWLCGLVAVWLSGNVVGLINEVTLRRARLVLRWVTIRGMPSRYLTKPPRPTQPGHPSVGRRNEYWRWLRPLLGKKWWVLRGSRPCYQDCWRTVPAG